MPLFEQRRLRAAAARGNTATVQALLNKGVNPESKSLFGRTTALNQAINKGQVESVKLFIERGKSPDEKDSDGYTLLMRASFADQAPIIEYLVSKGADLYAQAGESGMTALHYAAHMGKLNAVKTLLALGTPVDIENKNKGTPLIRASQQGHTDVVKYLLEQGADVNHADKRGITPLHAAAGQERFDIVKLLVEAGANVNAKNEAGRNPYGWAPTKVIRNYLAEKGANTTEPNQSGGKKTRKHRKHHKGKKGTRKH